MYFKLAWRKKQRESVKNSGSKSGNNNVENIVLK